MVFLSLLLMPLYCPQKFLRQALAHDRCASVLSILLQVSLSCWQLPSPPRVLIVFCLRCFPWAGIVERWVGTLCNAAILWVPFWVLAPPFLFLLFANTPGRQANCLAPTTHRETWMGFWAPDQSGLAWSLWSFEECTSREKTRAVHSLCFSPPLYLSNKTNKS